MICLHCEEMKRQRDEALLKYKGDLACALIDLSDARAARHQVEDSFAKVNAERDEVMRERRVLRQGWPEALAKMALMRGEIDTLLQQRKDLLDEVEILKSKIDELEQNQL